ncbi:hypothetical protein [Mechercharimyces sp. CAU 1602]|uniref:hypothetical protein n=1 Tax=Mechercharimyces sp. CAU 1602 TaxID=2973933 RepID=UPI0021625265|nr:hypothetical protein [Mechercharimyces sp. CAU 1602]MCS1352821.1 hypothetical protein [Mechercharimyces sp. CAU 1602]
MRNEFYHHVERGPKEWLQTIQPETMPRPRFAMKYNEWKRLTLDQQKAILDNAKKAAHQRPLVTRT